MTDKMRWRHGDTNPVVAAVDSATVIELGDLLWQDGDDAKPASMCSAWVDSLKDHAAANRDPEELQEEFARTFLGVAMQRSRSGETAQFRVAITGVFEFDCLSRTFELGDLVGIETSGKRRYFLGLFNQRVEPVSDSKYAIGRVAKLAHIPVASVLVDIRSRVMGLIE